jgi:O-antigen/teichoic acid export membrane protein
MVSGFKGYGKPITSSIGQTISIVVTFASMLWLLPRYDILGASWSLVLGAVAMSGYLLWRADRELVVTPLSLLAPTRQDWSYLRHHGSRLRARLRVSAKETLTGT